VKIRAELLLEIREHLRKTGLKQKEAAALLEINQPEVSALMNGMIYKFSIDALVNMLARLGHAVKIIPRRSKAA
jgi:predicted XRE-type DNA-binding protein